MHDYQDGEVRVGGLKMHYLEWGTPGKPPLVMLHGLNVQAHTWDPISRRLASDYHVFTPDLRGHGESDWSKTGYRVRSMSNDISLFVDALGIGEFDLLGHSAGVRVALSLAGERPDIVKKLILSDAGPETTRAGAEFMRDFIQRTVSIRGFRNSAEAREYYKKEHPEWVEEFIDLHVEHQLRKNWAGKLVLKADPDVQWITGSASLPDIPYLWKMCAQASMPTLLMIGRTSNVLDEGIVEKMTTVMPDAVALWFETGHYIPREQPEEFIAAVQDFLAAEKVTA
ncbi:MAG: alpha/beta hydrolase [Subtercola sp.]|nr:alpha/beta hydrolase [Subtercola sp.]